MVQTSGEIAASKPMAEGEGGDSCVSSGFSAMLGSGIPSNSHKPLADPFRSRGVSANQRSGATDVWLADLPYCLFGIKSPKVDTFTGGEAGDVCLTGCGDTGRKTRILHVDPASTKTTTLSISKTTGVFLDVGAAVADDNGNTVRLALLHLSDAEMLGAYKEVGGGMHKILRPEGCADTAGCTCDKELCFPGGKQNTCPTSMAADAINGYIHEADAENIELYKYGCPTFKQADIEAAGNEDNWDSTDMKVKESKKSNSGFAAMKLVMKHSTYEQLYMVARYQVVTQIYSFAGKVGKNPRTNSYGSDFAENWDKWRNHDTTDSEWGAQSWNKQRGLLNWPFENKVTTPECVTSECSCCFHTCPS